MVVGGYVLGTICFRDFTRCRQNFVLLNVHVCLLHHKTLSHKNKLKGTTLWDNYNLSSFNFKSFNVFQSMIPLVTRKFLILLAQTNIVFRQITSKDNFEI